MHGTFSDQAHVLLPEICPHKECAGLLKWKIVGSCNVTLSRNEVKSNVAIWRDCVPLNRKSYCGLSPVVDSHVGFFTDAVFLHTRNCSSKFRSLICLMNDRLFAHFLTQAGLC